MAALIAFYSRAGENYFDGAYRRISVGNTEKVAEMLADLTGGELYKIEQAEPYSDDYKACVAHARGQRPFRYRKRHLQGCPWRGGHEGPRHPRQSRGRGEERACPVG